MEGVVLVLNQNYEPLNVCNLPRAFRLVFGARAEVLEYDHQVIRTPRAGLPRARRDPPPAPDSAAAAPGQADSPRGLRPRRIHVSVLRPPERRPDAGSRRAAPSRRGPHLGQPGHGVQGLQPSQGRQAARGGPVSAGSPPDRAALRRLLALHAVPPRRPQRELAHLPVPWPLSRGGPAGRGRRGEAWAREIEIPAAVAELLATLRGGGHSAYVVGGCLRDALLGRDPADWDLTTDAPPDRIQETLPAVAVREPVRDRGGAPRPRPVRDHRVPARRLLHGSPPSGQRRVRRFDRGGPGPARLHRQRHGVGRQARRGTARSWIRTADAADLARRLLRAVGDPDRRFREDALRMVRAVRLAATLGFAVEAETLASIGRNAELARHLSGERIVGRAGQAAGGSGAVCRPAR